MRPRADEQAAMSFAGRRSARLGIEHREGSTGSSIDSLGSPLGRGTRGASLGPSAPRGGSSRTLIDSSSKPRTEAAAETVVVALPPISSVSDAAAAEELPTSLRIWLWIWRQLPRRS